MCAPVTCRLGIHHGGGWDANPHPPGHGASTLTTQSLPSLSDSISRRQQFSIVLVTEDEIVIYFFLLLSHFLVTIFPTISDLPFNTY